MKITKSIYFLKSLFTFIDEKTKLDIIKYNKNMQNIIGIKLTDYKIFSKRYIIYEKKGKGKEYYENGNLIFEGEYLNGQINGKVKEYDDFDGHLIFEGEYLNRKRNGKEKEYDGDGIILFEGEYLNGQRNGKGKEYYDGELIFEGEYLNGKRNGKGKEYDYDGNLKFEGIYLNGKRNGKGKEYNYNGELIFDGEYLKGNRWLEKFIIHLILVNMN